MEHKKGASSTATVRVRCAPVKIHGENSPDVLSGKVELGHREPITPGEPSMQEVTYEQAAEMFGKEAADGLFRGVKQEDDNG